jgi:hypothetical protein
VIEAGGTLLLIHHCNKQADLVGTEALSGHNAIAGAANTICTLHYLTDGKGALAKGVPERRLFSEGRSGPGFDLVVTPYGSGFRKVMGHDQWQQQVREAERQQRQEDKQAQRQEAITSLQQQLRDVLAESGEWMRRREICDALGVDWGKRGQSTEAKRVQHGLQRLVELGIAEKAGAVDRSCQEATYRSLTRRNTKEGSDHSDHSTAARVLALSEDLGSPRITSDHSDHSTAARVLADSPPSDLPLGETPDHSEPLQRRSDPSDPKGSDHSEPLQRRSDRSDQSDPRVGDPLQQQLPVVIAAPIGSAGLDLVDGDDPAWGARPGREVA